jgi:acyl-CoA thioesterase I
MEHGIPPNSRLRGRVCVTRSPFTPFTVSLFLLSVSRSPAPLSRYLLFALALCLAACGKEQPPVPRLDESDVVLAFGDSLTHGVGAHSEESYPALLSRLIGRRVVNAGVPGETSAEGLRRLPQALEEYRPKVLLLCLGGNDMLRRIPESQIAANLRAMVRMARSQGIGVVLIGVPEPKLFGGAPTFYADIAEEFGLPYEADVMNEVLRTPSLKSDAVHANAVGYRRVAEALADLLKQAGAI